MMNTPSRTLLSWYHRNTARKVTWTRRKTVNILAAAQLLQCSILSRLFNLLANSGTQKTLLADPKVTKHQLFRTASQQSYEIWGTQFQLPLPLLSWTVAFSFVLVFDFFQRNVVRFFQYFPLFFLFEDTIETFLLRIRRDCFRIKLK